ncbi:MAG: tetratricopeptide repeat protein [Porticoccaceae bacterium]|nr:tetratricopeptide repeat protein [Porticoccaceae bacterium]
MSLLMEALRKAEEAKRKDGEEPDHDQPLDQSETADGLGLSEPDPEVDATDVSEEASGSGDLQAEFDAALSKEENDSGEMKPLKMEELQAESLFQMEPSDMDSDSSPESAQPEMEAGTLDEEESVGVSSWDALDLHPIQEGVEPPAEESVGSSDGVVLSATPELPEQVPLKVDSENIDQRVLIDDFASDTPESSTLDENDDLDELNAWKSRARKISNPRDYKKIAFAIIVLLLLSGGGLFWYFGSEPAPQIATSSADRGFLGGPDPLEVSQLEDSPSETALQDDDSFQANASTIAIVDSSDSGAADSFIIGGDLDTEFQPSRIPNQSNRSFTQIEQTEVFRITTASVRSSELTELQSEASAAAQSGFNSHAREQYEWLLSAEPNNHEALLGLARLDVVAGNPEAARQSYLRLIELNPADPLARAGLLSLGQGDPLSEESELKSLAQRYPDTAPLSFALGNLLASQGRWNEAEGAYSRALISARASGDEQLSPDYSFNLAVALEQLSRPDEAYANYVEAMELSSEVAPSFDVDLLANRIRQLGQQLR